MTNAAANAGEQSGGTVGTTAGASASAFASGIYHGVCEGYKPEHKAEYEREYPRLLAMRTKRDQILRWMPKFANGMIAKFLRDLEQFEQYMKTLTETKWDNLAPNVVTTVGGNLALDTYLAGSGYTVTGPFMGLIGAVSYTGVPVIGDTMASHGRRLPPSRSRRRPLRCSPSLARAP